MGKSPAASSKPPPNAFLPLGTRDVDELLIVGGIALVERVHGLEPAYAAATAAGGKREDQCDGCDEKTEHVWCFARRARSLRAR
jgi:hypothetical protein